MSDILDRIDAVTAGLCPCGADPREGSAYCSYDCEPTHVSEHTEAPNCETARPGFDYFDPRYAPPTPMRWRPDLVTAADETDLIPLGSETHGYAGRFNAQVYERSSDPTVWHLRLDDGNLFVGCDLGDVGGRQDPISIELVGRVREAWQRLERKLTDTRDKVPAADDPWADVMVTFPDPARALLALARARSAGHVHVSFARHRLSNGLASYHSASAQVAAAQSLAGVADAVRVAARPMADLGAAVESFLRQAGMALTPWQRTMLEQNTITVVTPRRAGRSPAQWLSDDVWAALNQSGPTALRERPAPQADTDEPPTDPMQRALWLKRRRNTGPAQDRLDGRRRRRG